jgi:hypothetical protein
MLQIWHPSTRYESGISTPIASQTSPAPQLLTMPLQTAMIDHGLAHRFAADHAALARRDEARPSSRRAADVAGLMMAADAPGILAEHQHARQRFAHGLTSM